VPEAGCFAIGRPAGAARGAGRPTIIDAIERALFGFRQINSYLPKILF